MKNCKHCNIEFNPIGKQLYCSDKCVRFIKNLKRKKEPVDFECLICNTKFIQKRKDNTTCSSSCSQKLWIQNNPIKNTERYNGINAKASQKNWRLNNNERVKAIKNRYKKKKYLDDHLFKLKENVRNLIRASIVGVGKKKNTKTEQILGCSFSDFKNHIESLWES